MTNRDKGFIDGVAYATQILVTAFGNGALAGHIVHESGLQKEDFKHVDLYDRKVVNKLFRTEPCLIRQEESRRRERGKQ